MKSRFGIVLAAFAMVLAPSVVCVAPASADSAPKGAFTCDFQLPGSFPLSTVASAIERDRIYMARRPGMVNKFLPIRPDPTNGNIWSGGRYLFDTFEQARNYLDWVTNRYVLDGTHFLARPYFLNPDCHAWQAIGSWAGGDVTNRVAMRTERWLVPSRDQSDWLRQRWPALQQDAQARGISGVWLLYDRPDNLVTVVTYAARSAASPSGTDVAALASLETANPTTPDVAGPGWASTFDLTEFVLTIWFPNTDVGDNGRASLWPNSPVLPQPGSSDGLCEPSRGENNTTASGDCSKHCGDGVWQQSEETNQTCPSDVPYS